MLASSLDVSVTAEPAGVRFAFHVTNDSDRKVELQFGSGQKYDFQVLDASGRELWRWSGDRMFTQAFQTKTLDAKETMRYEEQWTPGTRTGTFTVVATLTSVNHPLAQRVEFSLP